MPHRNRKDLAHLLGALFAYLLVGAMVVIAILLVIVVFLGLLSLINTLCLNLGI